MCVGINGGVCASAVGASPPCVTRRGPRSYLDPKPVHRSKQTKRHVYPFVPSQKQARLLGEQAIFARDGCVTGRRHFATYHLQCAPERYRLHLQNEADPLTGSKHDCCQIKCPCSFRRHGAWAWGNAYICRNAPVGSRALSSGVGVGSGVGLGSEV